jgi:hypothetical protein
MGNAQEAVRLGNRRLQIGRSGPFFNVFFTQSTAMGLQIRQKLSSLGPLFAIDAPSPTASWKRNRFASYASPHEITR